MQRVRNGAGFCNWRGLKAGPRHTGEDVRQAAQAKAERIVQKELAHLEWGGFTGTAEGRRAEGQNRCAPEA